MPARKRSLAYYLLSPVGVALATAKALLELNSSRYTPYYLGTPHQKQDIDEWPEAAYRASTQDFNPEGENKKYSHEELLASIQSSRTAYAFIDRGVSRAQGLLQFNSIVFAGLVLFLSPAKHLPLPLKLPVLFVIALLSVSTILSLACLWIIWYRPEDHIDAKLEALLNWEIWLNRSLMFNSALALAAVSFIGVVAIIVFTILRPLAQ